MAVSHPRISWDGHRPPSTLCLTLCSPQSPTAFRLRFRFQLTVNIVACTVSTIGVFSHKKPVIEAVQMLWVNLIMDSLASLALASEPPTDDVLQRQPVNRSASLLSSQMLANMGVRVDSTRITSVDVVYPSPPPIATLPAWRRE